MRIVAGTVEGNATRVFNAEGVEELRVVWIDTELHAVMRVAVDEHGLVVVDERDTPEAHLREDVIDVEGWAYRMGEGEALPI